ncbi:sugar ABC transporter substrate-binding protein [Streptomyces sp. SBT349]|uniref:sugar ABC transporter substrate-binding protein n=1 Tax=Streptomyces sp. SBT349 TaxID=1580539 RepID=UPI00099C9375|nr:sugar ABC transporter substrate-binding protein [Streptomyces sp. SBT349]
MAHRPVKALVAAAAVALVATSCNASGSGGDGSVEGGAYKVAVLAASAQNGYNQAVYDGVVEGAKDLGLEVDAKILDGGFDATTQLSQLQTAATSGEYDGVIVVPHDGPSLTAGFPMADDLPVVTVLNPIGPDIDAMEPQVEGVVSTVAVPPTAAAERQAEDVVEHCADQEGPCKVMLLVGNLSSPLDVARRDAYQSVLEREDGIEIVSTLEGNYDRDQSLSTVANAVQSHRDVDVILSNADQMTLGAEVALTNAGIDPSSVYLTGGGGTTEALQAVREGRWAADYVNFPVSMGAAAMEQLANALGDKPVEPHVDADTVGPEGVEPYADADTLAGVEDFTGEWNG